MPNRPDGKVTELLEQMQAAGTPSYSFSPNGWMTFQDGKWINYAVELHLRAELCMAPEIVSELTYAAEVARGVDHALYSFYVEWLREVAPKLGPLAGEIVEQLDDVKLPSR